MKQTRRKLVGASAATGAIMLAGCGGGAAGGSVPVSPVSPPPPSPPPPPPPPPPPVPGLYPDYNVSPKPADSTNMTRTASAISAKIALGWNIGNTLEATGGETAWGNPQISQAYVNFVKAQGFDAIRLPCAWDQYANQTTAEISSVWLARVKQVVDYCIAQDLFVVLNIHWDGGWLETHVDTAFETAVTAKQKAYWQQIATYFRDYDDRLIFASANEPNAETAAKAAVLLRYHQTCIDAVRATGGRNAYRVIVVQGPNTDFDKTNQFWTTMPTDTVANRLMMELHYYTPWNFTGMTQDESWGNQFYYWGAGNHSTTDTAHNPTWGEEADCRALFAKVKRQFIDAGIPVIIGEFGAQKRTNLTGSALALHLASRLSYFEFVAHEAVSNGMSPFFWDTGGILDRRNQTVLEADSLHALLKGAGKVA